MVVFVLLTQLGSNNGNAKSFSLLRSAETVLRSKPYCTKHQPLQMQFGVKSLELLASTEKNVSQLREQH